MVVLHLPIGANTLMRLLLSVLLVEGYAVWRRHHQTSFWIASAMLLLICALLCLLLIHLF